MLPTFAAAQVVQRYPFSVLDSEWLERVSKPKFPSTFDPGEGLPAGGDLPEEATDAVQRLELLRVDHRVLVLRPLLLHIRADEEAALRVTPEETGAGGLAGHAEPVEARVPVLRVGVVGAHREVPGGGELLVDVQAERRTGVAAHEADRTLLPELVRRREEVRAGDAPRRIEGPVPGLTIGQDLLDRVVRADEGGGLVERTGVERPRVAGDAGVVHEVRRGERREGALIVDPVGLLLDVDRARAIRRTRGRLRSSGSSPRSSA